METKDLRKRERERERDGTEGARREGGREELYGFCRGGSSAVMVTERWGSTAVKCGSLLGLLLWRVMCGGWITVGRASPCDGMGLIVGAGVGLLGWQAVLARLSHVGWWNIGCMGS